MNPGEGHIETRGAVLIVEDEKEIRRFVRHALEAEGFRVFEADTLQRGLIEAGTRKPDLVILDLGLPDGDGANPARPKQLITETGIGYRFVPV